MFSDLSLFKTASALAAHSSARQTTIAQNMANSDTPGFLARDIESFSTVMDTPRSDFVMKTTRSAHISSPGTGISGNVQEVESPGDQSPNGNSVSIETEMFKSAEVKHSHDMAVTVYKSGLTLLRTALGKT